jgi:hypothetical protein
MDYQTPAPYATAITFTRVKTPRSYKNDNRLVRKDIRRDVRTFKRTANFMLDMIDIGVATLDRAAGFRDTQPGFEPEGVCSIMNYALVGQLFDDSDDLRTGLIGYHLCALFMSREKYVDGLGSNNTVTAERRELLERIARTDVEAIVKAYKDAAGLGARFGILA